MKKPIGKCIMIAALALTAAGCSGDSGTPASVDPNYEITRDVYAIQKETRYGFMWDYEEPVLDGQGHITSVTLAGSSRAGMTFEYNDAGQLIKSTDDHGMYGVTTREYSYNTDGTLKAVYFMTTDTNYKVPAFQEEFTYNSEGKLTRITSTSKGGDPLIYDITYDSFGRVNDMKYYVSGSLYSEDIMYYTDQSLFPYAKSEQTKYHAFAFEENFDSRWNLTLENVLDEKNERSTNEFDYGIIGQVTESPATNPDLVTRDQWQYFPEAKSLPIPSSCFNSVKDGTEPMTYTLPASWGVYTPALGDLTYYDPLYLNTSKAFIVYDQYRSILSQLCGFEIHDSGNSFTVSKEGKTIAVVEIVEDASRGLLMKVSVLS